MFIFDNSCEQIFNSEAFVEYSTAGRHLGWITIYNKHYLLHRSKLGWDDELQRTQIVLFISPVMWSRTLSAQFDLGSELVDWYWNAMSVPYGHLMIDQSPRTDDRLRYCPNTGSIHSIFFYVPECLKHIKTLDDEHTKSLYSPSVPVYHVFWRILMRSAQRKPPQPKKTSPGKISKRILIALSRKRVNWKQGGDVLTSEKGVQLIKVVTPSVLNQLSSHGQVCSPSCFCIQQEFEYPVS